MSGPGEMLSAKAAVKKTIQWLKSYMGCPSCWAAMMARLPAKEKGAPDGPARLLQLERRSLLRRLLRVGRLVERLAEVAEDVVDVLEADREAHIGVADAG